MAASIDDVYQPAGFQGAIYMLTQAACLLQRRGRTVAEQSPQVAARTQSSRCGLFLQRSRTAILDDAPISLCSSYPSHTTVPAYPRPVGSSRVSGAPTFCSTTLIALDRASSRGARAREFSTTTSFSTTPPSSASRTNLHRGAGSNVTNRAKPLLFLESSTSSIARATMGTEGPMPSAGEFSPSVPSRVTALFSFTTPFCRGALRRPDGSPVGRCGFLYRPRCCWKGHPLLFGVSVVGVHTR